MVIYMYKYALINNQNIVQNVVSWDGESNWTPPADMTCLNVENIECGIGWTFDGSTFSEPRIVVLTPELIVVQQLAPTKEELIAQLQALTQQVQSLN
jgi:hypothetical protein